MQQRIFAKNAPKLQKSSCDSPKNGDSYFKNKCFTIFGTCNIMCIFNTCHPMKNYDMQYAHKIIKNIPSPNLAKMLSFVIILLSSREADAYPMHCNDIIYRATNDSCKIRLLDLPNLLSFCYHCY